MKDFIEVHCIEFGSDETIATPVMMRIDDIISFQSITQRIRRQLMENQIHKNEILEDNGYRPDPIKELPMNCSAIELKSAGPVALRYVEESYEELKHKLGLNKSKVTN